MTQHNSTGSPWLIWILFGLMGLVSLACIGTGGTAWAYGVQTWAQHDYLFSGWQMLDWFIGLLGAALVGVGLLISGFFFRFVRWPKAHLASLALSIMNLAFILVTYAIYSQTSDGLSSPEKLMLQAGCILGLFVVVLPPFLHWFLARQRPQVVAQMSDLRKDAAKVP